MFFCFYVKSDELDTAMDLAAAALELGKVTGDDPSGLWVDDSDCVIQGHAHASCIRDVVELCGANGWQITFVGPST